MVKRLYRSRRQRMLAGVCGGIAEYSGVDPTVVRLLWALAGIFPPTLPFALIGYFFSWLLIPDEPAA